MKEFRSKFTGKCAKCHGVISIGDPISWDRKAARGQRTWHKDCCGPSVSAGPNEEQMPDETRIEENGILCDICGLHYEPGHYVIHRETEAHKKAVIQHINETSAPVIEALTEQKEEAPVMNEPVSNDNTDNPIDDLARALDRALKASAVVPVIDEAKVQAIVNKALQGFTTPLTVVLETPDKAPKTISGVHKVFPEVLAVANARESVYLRGPAGSGKSTIARQVAEALELPFGMISLNVQTADYKLFGSMDAHNSYRGTAFREKFEQGGVFLIDEIDNASGNLLTTLNTALANGHMAFPDGLVARHPDFICIATGNTAGRGASRLHSERRALDSATLDRFYSILVEYDWTLVRSIAKTQNPKADAWVDWTKQASEYCAKNLPTMIISPRCAIMGAKLARLKNIKTIDALADGVAFKGIDDTSRRAIVDNVKLPALADLR